MNIQIPRGVNDFFENDMNLHMEVVNKLSEIFENYGYGRIKTPIFEDTKLFIRSVGDDTDIVNKEMYTFEDRKGRSLTLRPELTAPVVRSYLENKMYGKLDDFNKFYYYGEAFRYERAQAGRYRQFHQVGVEVFNLSSIAIDIEVISMADSIIKFFDLSDNVKLKINTIGSSKERKEYIKYLKNYFEPHKEELCSDCQNRIETNPLRILDCKKDGHRNIVTNVKPIKDFLDLETNERFISILEYLDNADIQYDVDYKMVRGLDYYNDTVFEFVFKNEDLEFTLIGGGRYDKLISQISQQDIPAFGFGIGVERMILALKSINSDIEKDYSKKIDIYFANLDENRDLEVLEIMNNIRNAGLSCEMNYMNKGIKQCYKKAEELNAIYVVVISDEVRVKNLFTKEETVTSLKEFEEDILKEIEDGN